MQSSCWNSSAMPRTASFANPAPERLRTRTGFWLELQHQRVYDRHNSSDTAVEPQAQEQEDRPSDAPIREALVKFLINGTGATLWVRRSGSPASKGYISYPSFISGYRS